jgi:peptidoglycan/LPS O-acetylase OafA/YrhL
MVKVLPRIACVVCAIAALWLAFMTYNDVALAGFPDGHVTDYDKAADPPLGILSYVQAGFGLLFLVLAFSPIKARRRAAGLLVALIAFVLVALVGQVGVPWYFGTHLRLDNGIGG